MLEREQRDPRLPRGPRHPLGGALLGLSNPERICTIWALQAPQASDPCGSRPLSPARRRARPPGHQPRSEREGRGAKQVAIRSASEHSWAAPVDINNRQAGSEKSPGGGYGVRKKGFI